MKKALGDSTTREAALSALKSEYKARLRVVASELMPSIMIPPLFEQRARFGNLEWIEKRHKSNANVVRRCVEFAECAERGFLMTGKSGTGKSHLVWAIARRIVERHRQKIEDMMSEKMLARMEAQVDGGEMWHPPRRSEWPTWYGIEVVSGPELAHTLRHAIDNGTVHATVDHYKHVGILFIEDLDVAKIGDWLAEEFYRIIDARYFSLLPTCFTSNLSLDELGGCVGDRLARRIADMTEPLVLT